MRIIAGRFRGLTLASVGKGDAGAHLRPTSDRVRESLFSMLTGGRFGDPVEGAKVLDLFAGTGALGLEALSRGAAHVTFVDDGRKAQTLIHENIAKCRCADQVTVLKRDATRLPGGSPYDLIFLDPPYGKGLGEKALDAASKGGWIAPNALIVWEESATIAPPDGVTLLDTRQYGDTVISVLRRV
ncbi:16S rRNA (guanine(966)-N(2))-methyltransferase RsmD [Aliiroseovarius sediminis]|uniref:16S rRNA (guanine(966)-N(2))-methyltransferase RsmD n=1 Tax=Aliiroseovarius sediminis TaxID=2925839 RepID=UPI001F599085|nr:16S rRNA (guanine(966)-N(2))-methyltransferase RsmD [Aliiroseovarius sediminis]MCI2395502.1 16S rRNA (guanine(966)-N(2))-methyltransferase RsmD [Aliiroseovarius sediminis]